MAKIVAALLAIFNAPGRYVDWTDRKPLPGVCRCGEYIHPSKTQCEECEIASLT